MLQCATVYTYEIDDPELALREITSQLHEKLPFQKNTVGIVMCHPEYCIAGTAQYVCERLPFDVVGVTTSSQAVNGAEGDMILTLFVMTADDIIFRAGLTESLEDEVEGPTREAYGRASAGMTETPRLALLFPPLILQYAGDVYPAIFSEILPDTPSFGTIAIDDTVFFDTSETIFNGINSKTRMGFVLCYGNIHPRFLVGALPENNVLPYQGEVTKANGPYVSEINNKSAYQYFDELGLTGANLSNGSLYFVPFLIDLRKRQDYDGIPVMRTLAKFEEDGTAIFRGNVDENSIFTLSKCTEEDVVSGARESAEKVNALGNVRGVLSFSCCIRRMVVGSDYLREMQGVSNTLRPDIPFMFGYAGGEICPTSVRNGKPANRFHNYTLITLIL